MSDQTMSDEERAKRDLFLRRQADESSARDLPHLLDVLYGLAREGVDRASDEARAGHVPGEAAEADEVVRFDQAMSMNRLAAEARDVAGKAIDVLIAIAADRAAGRRFNRGIDCSRLNSEMGRHDAMTDTIELLERDR